MAGQTKFLGDGSCSGVTDPLAGTKLLWDTCDYSLGAFSPDGRYIVGLAAYSDGPGSPSLSILDATTGEPLVDYRGPKDGRTCIGVDQAVWEDDDTVLATRVAGRRAEHRPGRAQRRAIPGDAGAADRGSEHRVPLPNHPFG